MAVITSLLTRVKVTTKRTAYGPVPLYNRFGKKA